MRWLERLAMNYLVRCWSRRVALIRNLNGIDGSGTLVVVKIEKMMRRELVAVPATVEAFFAGQRTEADILSDRLTRRFDPAMALSEATNRAIVEKQRLYAEMEGFGLTAKQKAALELQHETLKRRLRDA